MGDVDIEAILQEMKEGKPPFKCPFCGKSYKTFSGISQHLSTCDKETKQESDDDKPFNISNSRYKTQIFVPTLSFNISY